MFLHKTNRRQWSWTEYRTAQAAEVRAVVDELEDYWPLTLRQIYYRIVAAGHIENTRSRYNDLSKLIKQMRVDDMLPWHVLTDRARRMTDKRGYTDHTEFLSNLEKYVKNLDRNYTRCFVQNQERYVEIWCEKDALSQVFERVAWPYCIRAVTCKGYDSATFLDDYRRRAKAAQARGQTPVILYFGDLDPSGWQALEASKQTLEDEMDLWGVEYVRVALNPEQIDEYQLPHDPQAVKTTDSRYKKYVQRFGNLAVELDALHPATLTDMAEDAVRCQFDMDAFAEQEEIETSERQKLAAFKHKILEQIRCLTSHT
jgi:hypothetical protein